jgi:hypothetical protein
VEPGAQLASSPSHRASESAEISHPCPNCERITAGARFCGECGQDRRDPSRSLSLLVADAVAEFFSLEGRTARTVRRLLLRPGALTADWVEGRRARFTPPLKLYLGSSAAFFLGWLVTRPVDQAYYGLEGGGAAGYANTMARVLILLLPTLAVLFRILAPFRRRPLVQQMVFSLHFGAFALLWTLAMTLTAAAFKAWWGHYLRAPAWLPDFPILLYLPGLLVVLGYLALAIRGAWGDARVAVLLRVLVVAVAAVAAFFFLVPALLQLFA